MSRHEDNFQLSLPPEEAKNLCGQAITSLGWPIVDLGYGWSTSESFNLGFTWPVSMQVVINYGDAGMSRLTIKASNFGFGPIQSSHVKGKVRTLRQRIEQMFQQGPQPPAQSQPQPQPPAQPSSQARQSKGEEIFRDGVLLEDKGQ
ncbi:MAG: hypothetical protein ABJB61_10640 [bacterium]